MVALIAKISQFTQQLLIDFGLSAISIKYIVFGFLVLCGFVFFIVGTHFSHWLFNLFLTHTNKKNQEETLLIKSLKQYKVLRCIANLIPLAFLGLLVQTLKTDFPELLPWVIALLDTIFLLFLLRLLRAFLRAMCYFLQSQEHYRDKPLESYAQIIMLVMYFLALAFLYVKYTSESLTGFFGTLGAISAVLLLIFKDTIMGVVSSVQVSLNDMVRVGDWITMTKYGADGSVIEINLTTVKVSNFDNTVTTIPTYALTSDSFQNWRYMFETGCRRIKRSIIIKPSSIKFITIEDAVRFKKIQLISNYIDQQQAEIDANNQKENIDKEQIVNGRNLTNFGLFRQYVELYLNQESTVSKQTTLMVRPLQSTEYGFPLEIYAFLTETRWVQYEKIQADLFDHIIAAAFYFDLTLCEDTD